MKTLFYEFTIDKDKKTLTLKREFAANLELVWKAWTSPELLDQWWGPKPWRAETKSMDFREGGHWLYAMVGPAGEKHWSKATYMVIEPEKSFTQKDGFCDENGTMNPDFPQNILQNSFIPFEENVIVEMLHTFDNYEDIEKIIQMGFKEGIEIDFLQLDELLGTLG